ncbi:Na+/H+ antiporter NhaC family protein [Acidaminobacter hydrogenoformans]|uniref:Transporter, NhaC family n=1 Tax=Acidaminobacter hydrogenoformans DSM 2784 TaxID=1120920 RepID=A0A1G5RPX8_9FIRM|nr:Na+/H+ antiporter NhaC family protein [Acidaminobacter hydrogenoformans]SCZ76182.1 transporter, NhaC family [Acidaminobacter hydrogenoformans DSM 2784]
MLTFRDSLITLLMVVLCIVSAILLQISLFWGFATAILLLLFFFGRKGFDPRVMIDSALIAVRGCTVVYVVILLMGASIAIWIASGVIPAIIYYGLEWFAKETFLMAAFLITAVVAMIMGTGLGTLSTIGIALMGIGSGFGFAPPLILGAILSGSYIADKLSPVNGLVNLQLGVAKLPYKTYARAALKTTIPVMLVCAGLYAWLGSTTQTVSAAVDTEVLRGALSEQYVMSPLLFAIPALLLAMTFKGFKIHVGMLVCILIGSLTAILIQGAGILQLAGWLLGGYSLSSDTAPLLAGILKGGGVLPMLEVLMIVLCAVAFSGILERTDALAPLMGKLISERDGPGRLTVKTGLLSILFLSVSCDQTLPILLPVKSLRSAFEARGLTIADLVRTVSDTGVIMAPLQFWNVNTIIIVGLTGITPAMYGKYSVLLYLFPLTTVLYAIILGRRGISRPRASQKGA